MRMENCLVDNFEFIQAKINGIKNKDFLDIKDISDLQRYVEMQKNIIYALTLLNEYEIDC